MILIINTCAHEMHYHEFVRPIEDILRKNEVPFDVMHYSKLNARNINKMIDKYHRIILTGTSLRDMEYSKDISRFKKLSETDKPMLGICGGMQILCMINGCRLFDHKEIGQIKMPFNAEFLGASGFREVYALHNMAIKEDAALKDNFKIYSKSINDAGGCVQAVKHKKYKHYGMLFHPEVRNKDMIVNFLSV